MLFNIFFCLLCVFDGCVVLINQDFDVIVKNFQVGLILVIISNLVEWLLFDDWVKECEELNKMISNWCNDWESFDIVCYFKYYLKCFRFGDQDLEQFVVQKKQINFSKEWVKIKIDNFLVFCNLGKEEVVVVIFDQNYCSNNLNNVMKKCQYWLCEVDKWKIIYEGSV